MLGLLAAVYAAVTAAFLCIPEQFDLREDGAVLLHDDGRRTFLTAWQKRKDDEIRHPFLDEKVQWGMLPYVQALLLSRYLRGDLDAYPPFLWK